MQKDVEIGLFKFTFTIISSVYLVCILFGMPSLQSFTFLMFKSCFGTFLILLSVTVRPKPNKTGVLTTTPELEKALTI